MKDLLLIFLSTKKDQSLKTGIEIMKEIKIEDMKEAADRLQKESKTLLWDKNSPNTKCNPTSLKITHQWETGQISIVLLIETQTTSDRKILNQEITITWKKILHTRERFTKIMKIIMSQLKGADGLMIPISQIRVSNGTKGSPKTRVKISTIKESIVKEKLTTKSLNKMLLTWIKIPLNLEHQEPIQTTISSKDRNLVILLTIETGRTRETLLNSFRIKKKSAGWHLMKFTRSQTCMEETKDEFYVEFLLNGICWYFLNLFIF